MILSIKTLTVLATSLFFSASFGWASEDEPRPEESAAAVDNDEEPTPPAAVLDEAATVFESDHGEMQTLEEETRFLLTGNVKVSGNNLRVFCDRLEVYAARDGGDNRGEGLAEPGRIQRILAIGNVRIEQEGREATAGRAEVFPVEGRIVFTEDPMIRDAQGRVTGERITLFQGEARAVVEGGEKGPARITLPTLPDLGIDGEPRNREEEPERDD